MAEITFQTNMAATSIAPAASYTLSGSGLGFFGTTAGSSVQIGSYQDTTYISNADGSVTKGAANNTKYVASTYPSGMAYVAEDGSANYYMGLSGVKSHACTLGIQFGHTTAVKTQNVQLRIYDRTNINNPASGVNTKVAELVNFGGAAYNNQDSDTGAGVGSAFVGSGDSLWWGEPWPDEMVANNYYKNSVGTTFKNGLDTVAELTNVNGDVRLGQVTGDRETVGGSGVVVPLLDSPGSGQKQLSGSEAITTGMVWPKWTQYIDSSKQSTLFGAGNNFGDGSNVSYIANTYGGTGIDTHHTWCVALSATPLAIGSKEQYGLYVSLEYL